MSALSPRDPERGEELGELERRPRLASKRVERTEDGRYIIYYDFEDGPDEEERP